MGRALICDAVYLANRVAKGIEGVPLTTATEPAVLEGFGLNSEGLEKLTATARDQFDVVRARYGGE